MKDAEARGYLQECLDAVRMAERNQGLPLDEYLDHHTRYATCVRLVRVRASLTNHELSRWVSCAHNPSQPSPLECPAWGSTLEGEFKDSPTYEFGHVIIRLEDYEDFDEMAWMGGSE